MRRLPFTVGIAAVIAMGAYVVSYFHCVHEGAAVSTAGLSFRPAYSSSLLSEKAAQALYAPIHAVDRKFLRQNKWGDALEALVSNAHVLPQAKARMCGLHHTWRTVAVVPVRYGTPDIGHPYFAARKTIFPNSWSHVDGGCVSGPGSQTQVVVRACQRCRDAEEKWEAAQK